MIDNVHNLAALMAIHHDHDYVPLHLENDHTIDDNIAMTLDANPNFGDLHFNDDENTVIFKLIFVFVFCFLK